MTVSRHMDSRKRIVWDLQMILEMRIPLVPLKVSDEGIQPAVGDADRELQKGREGPVGG